MFKKDLFDTQGKRLFIGSRVSRLPNNDLEYDIIEKNNVIYLRPIDKDLKSCLYPLLNFVNTKGISESLVKVG